MGTCVSSYGNTMGFSASTEVEKETTRSCDTLSHILLNKINQLYYKVSINLLTLLSDQKCPKPNTKDINCAGRRALCLII